MSHQAEGTGTSNGASSSQRLPALTGTTVANSGLVSLFDCPVCFNYVLPPILQCESGHLVCGDCRAKLTHCPTCRGPLTAIRSLAMEKVADTVRIPCKHASLGCEITLPLTERADHEEHCEFRPCRCPCPAASCGWQGRMDAIVPHLTQRHESILTLQGEVVLFLGIHTDHIGGLAWVMMLSCFGFHFIFILEKLEAFYGHEKFFAVVQLIGTREQADSFAYRLDLNGDRRRLMWESTPLSIHEEIATAIMNIDCLAFHPSIAELFTENGE